MLAFFFVCDIVYFVHNCILREQSITVKNINTITGTRTPLVGVSLDIIFNVFILPVKAFRSEWNHEKDRF